jgi:hypothetical protein
MKRLIVKGVTIAVMVAALALPLASPAFADQNPQGTGQPGAPNNVCGSSNPVSPGNGNNASSPGSPFSSTGGIGGANYNPLAQYDIACYQLSH